MTLAIRPVDRAICASSSRKYPAPLFGAVTTKEISEGLQKQYGIDVPKQKLVLEDPIKAFGSYELRAKLGYEVSGTIYVMLVEEK